MISNPREATAPKFVLSKIQDKSVVDVAIDECLSYAAELALINRFNATAQLLPAVYAVVRSTKADMSAKASLLKHGAFKSRRAALSNADVPSIALALVSRPKGSAERAEHKTLERILRRASALNIEVEEFKRRLPELVREIETKKADRTIRREVSVLVDSQVAEANAASFRIVLSLPDRSEFVFSDTVPDTLATALIDGTVTDEDYLDAYRAFLQTAMRHTSVAFILDG